MRLLRSLRARLLLGSLLWTLGLLPIVHVLSVLFLMSAPGSAGLPRVIFIAHPEHAADVMWWPSCITADCWRCPSCS